MKSSSSRKARRLLKRRLIALLVVIGVLVVCFGAGALWSQRRTRTEITTDLISQRLHAVSELATVEYHYTNMAKFENQADFYGWAVPLTQKSFIVSYDGVIKAGINAADLSATVTGKIITVVLPSSTILSHEIEDDSLEIFDESKNLFNPLTITDFTNFSADQKQAVEDNALEKGLLIEASAKAKTAVRELLELVIATPDTYEIIIK